MIVSGRSARSSDAPSGQRRRRVMMLSASWLPRIATTRMPSRVNRSSCRSRNWPVRQSCQSPSYRSPAINTSFTCSDNATSTRLISASRVALRMRSAGASESASSPRSGLSRCKSAQWRKRKASTGQAGSPARRSATASTSADRRIGCGIGRDLSLMSHDGYHICNSACEACDATG